MVCVIGVSALVKLPVDLFPNIKIPVVVVATFYSGMPPEQIENDITSRFERFFTLASSVDHIESRSLQGVSLIKVYFQPGTNPDSSVTSISNLAMANLRRLPPGTLPPVVLKFDASSLPVCLITLKGEGLNETQLRDVGQFTVRNQVANVPGASVPQPFGGRTGRSWCTSIRSSWKLTNSASWTWCARSTRANLILPAGDVKIGPFDYNLSTNSQLPTINQINSLPLKTVGGSPVTVADVGQAKDGAQIQTNEVRIDGQKSVVPARAQAGRRCEHHRGRQRHPQGRGRPARRAEVARDQRRFRPVGVREDGHRQSAPRGGHRSVPDGADDHGLPRQRPCDGGRVFVHPALRLATFLFLSFGDNSINSMILGGLALAFSRLIDNSVVVLENIFRHLEMGESPEVAAEKGGQEVALPVLAATFATVVVFFPVTFLYGVSQFLFTALALSVVLSLFASYVVAMTVVPLFCAKLIKGHGGHGDSHPPARRV